MSLELKLGAVCSSAIDAMLGWEAATFLRGSMSEESKYGLPR